MCEIKKAVRHLKSVNESGVPDTVVMISDDQFDKAYRALSAKFSVMKFDGNIGVLSQDKKRIDKVLKEHGFDGFVVSK